MKVIEYFYAAHSAFAYLGSARFMAIAAASGRKIAHRPVDLRRVVSLNGDQPLATYMTAHNASGAQLVRTRQGYWLPWSGREEDLSDVGLTPQSGTLEYKLLKEDLPTVQLPITVAIGYRTAQGVKFGVFEIRAQ